MARINHIYFRNLEIKCLLFVQEFLLTTETQSHGVFSSFSSVSSCLRGSTFLVSACPS
jgi:hypothetical protein